MSNEEEKKLIENCKIWVQEEDVYYTRWFGLDELSVLVNLIEKQQERIETIKEYAHQEVAHINEDIKDYIDDDKIENKDIIGELKEKKEHWKDIERIIEGKENEELYMNWWRYGLYD